MLYVSGIGYVTDNKLSVEYKKQSWNYDGTKNLHRCLKDNGIVQDVLKDFGRLDSISKMTVTASALALYDASVSMPKDKIGILGTSDAGSLSSNIDFFKDYVDSGRKMSRGNLFVYTLSSAALAAAAIAFGFKGPITFEMYGSSPFHHLIKSAERIICDQNCKGLILIYPLKDKVSAYLLEKLDGKLSSRNDLMTTSELKL
jgi:hypothetical protein